MKKSAREIAKAEGFLSAAELGVSAHLLETWSEKGLVRRMVIGSSKFYDAGEVQSQRSHETTVPIGYELLADLAEEFDVNLGTAVHWCGTGAIRGVKRKPNGIGNAAWYGHREDFIARLDGLEERRQASAPARAARGIATPPATSPVDTIVARLEKIVERLERVLGPEVQWTADEKPANGNSHA